MRKSTWLLLVLALAAILLVAGCSPTTPPNGEEPGNGEPTPPADTAAPKVVKTMVSKVHDPAESGWFKITIVFDEDIYSPCAENPNNWEIRVVNSQRVEDNDIDLAWRNPQIVGNQIILYVWVTETGAAPATTYELVPLPGGWAGFGADLVAGDPISLWREALQQAVNAAQGVVEAVEGFSDTELWRFLALYGGAYDNLLVALEGAKEVLENPLAAEAEIEAALGNPVCNLVCNLPEPPVEPEGEVVGLNAAFACLGFMAEATTGEPPVFAGLICSEEDAAEYKEVFGKEVTVADVVTWELSNNCAISDILGNSQCGYSGEACCVSPYCEECVECDLTTGVCK